MRIFKFSFFCQILSAGFSLRHLPVIDLGSLPGPPVPSKISSQPALRTHVDYPVSHPYDTRLCSIMINVLCLSVREFMIPQLFYIRCNPLWFIHDIDIPFWSSEASLRRCDSPPDNELSVCPIFRYQSDIMKHVKTFVNLL